jgi:hypothetical protein
MSSQDLQKQRQGYLKKKADMIGRSVYLALLGCVFLSFAAIYLLVVWKIYNGALFQVRYQDWVGILTFTTVGMIVLWASCRQEKQIMYLPYVPPVTSDILPAEEVLVRSSQEPTQEQSTVLLRAAGENGDKPEQLLRASLNEVKNDIRGNQL